MNFVHMRPVSPHVPLERAARLPQLRELVCPWLWDRLFVDFSSQTLHRFSRVREGRWCNARAEFGRVLRHVVPLLLSSFTQVCFWFWKPNPYKDDTYQAERMPALVGTSLSSSSSSSSSSAEFESMDPVSLGPRDLGSCLEVLKSARSSHPIFSISVMMVQ